MLDHLMAILFFSGWLEERVMEHGEEGCSMATCDEKFAELCVGIS